MVLDVNGFGMVTEISGVLSEPAVVEDVKDFVVFEDADDHGLKISCSVFLTGWDEVDGLLEEENILVLCL